MITYSILFLAVSLIPANAYAYLDPGTGTMVLQLLVAGIAGLGVAIKFYWRRVLGFFKPTSCQKATEADSQEK